MRGIELLSFANAAMTFADIVKVKNQLDAIM